MNSTKHHKFGQTPTINTSGIVAWDEYDGDLVSVVEPEFASFLYGVSHEGPTSRTLEIPAVGAAFGYVVEGEAFIDPLGYLLGAGEWFCLANGGSIDTNDDRTRVVVMQRIGWMGIGQAGGPIEERGRLKYIDTCSDTLIVGPPKKGDACLNHLHFPAGIDQTQHTHPSARLGVVARGRGTCTTPEGVTELMPGRVFWIPTDGPHSFQTPYGETMDIIAYHPDSDFGPADEEHPMVNRTLVDGEKIDNTAGVHADAVVVDPKL